MDRITKNRIDLAYLTGVFNVSGIDGMHNEIQRLKSLGMEPHQLFPEMKVDQVQEEHHKMHSPNFLETVYVLQVEETGEIFGLFRDKGVALCYKANASQKLIMKDFLLFKRRKL